MREDDRMAIDDFDEWWRLCESDVMGRSNARGADDNGGIYRQLRAKGRTNRLLLLLLC